MTENETKAITETILNPDGTFTLHMVKDGQPVSLRFPTLKKQLITLLSITSRLSVLDHNIHAAAKSYAGIFALSMCKMAHAKKPNRPFDLALIDKAFMREAAAALKGIIKAKPTADYQGFNLTISFNSGPPLKHITRPDLNTQLLNLVERLIENDLTDDECGLIELETAFFISSLEAYEARRLN